MTQIIKIKLKIPFLAAERLFCLMQKYVWTTYWQ